VTKVALSEWIPSAYHHSVNAFKGSLDKFWNSQDVFYDWEADFKTGTGLLIT
jgi:hypothetical protein